MRRPMHHEGRVRATFRSAKCRVRRVASNPASASATCSAGPRPARETRRTCPRAPVGPEARRRGTGRSRPDAPSPLPSWEAPEPARCCRPRRGRARRGGSCRRAPACARLQARPGRPSGARPLPDAAASAGDQTRRREIGAVDEQPRSPPGPASRSVARHARPVRPARWRRRDVAHDGAGGTVSTKILRGDVTTRPCCRRPTLTCTRRRGATRPPFVRPFQRNGSDGRRARRFSASVRTSSPSRVHDRHRHVVGAP